METFKKLIFSHLEYLILSGFFYNIYKSTFKIKKAIENIFNIRYNNFKSRKMFL